MNDIFYPIAQSCLGSPPPKGSFFLASKKNKTEALPSSLMQMKTIRKSLIKCRLKFFLSKPVVSQRSPKNLLGRV